jgi:uncharacterized delta-60 repeat protein
MIHRVPAFLLTLSFLAGPALAADGTLDPSFNGTGKVLTVFNPASPVNIDQAFTVLVQPDQKIVAVGFLTDVTDPADFGAARYNPDGTLDRSFGNNGLVRVGFGFFAADQAFAAARQPDGKIVIGGYTSSATPLASPAFALARLRTDGTLDPQFGSGGLAQTDLGGDDWIFALALQPDGKILAAGVTGSPASHDFALVRYNANGSLDTAFGTGGKVRTDFSGREDRPAAVAVQKDGKILVAGLSSPTSAPNSPPQMALARYTSAGKPDTTFGTGGKLLLVLGGKSAATALKVLSTGKILVGGGLFQATAGGYNFLLVRLNPSGTLDTTFGTGGKVATDFGGRTDGIHGIAVLTNGKIVAGGEANATSFGSGDGVFGLARYTANGQLDTTFGTGGKVTTQLGDRGSRATSLAVQADGRIVLGGHVFSTNPAQGTAFGLARYLATVPAQALAARDGAMVEDGEEGSPEEP